MLPETVQALSDYNIDVKKLPLHIAIIMDGNGRWAKKHGYQRIKGHEYGAKSVRDVCECCAELGIPYLSLYTFSRENWRRPKKELSMLFKLLEQTLDSELETLQKNNIKLTCIGNIYEIPENCIKKLTYCMQETKDNTRMELCLAINYSGQWDIYNAIDNLIKQIDNKKIDIKACNVDVFKSYLSTASKPDPDMLIRTAGEKRISNFFLWQAAYSELHFSDKWWPDFRREDIYHSIADYQKRIRKFGGL